jgi:dynein regulatory complex subunit 2
MALRNHLIHVDELIELQQSRLRGLKEEFKRDVSIIKEEFDTEKREIAQSHREETRELHDMIETIREEEEAKLAKMKNDFDGHKVETQNKHVEDLDQMRNALTKQIEDYDDKFEVNFQNYLTATQ